MNLNDLPLFDLYKLIINNLNAIEISNLKQTCQLWNELIPWTIYKQHVSICQHNFNILLHHFKSEEAMPWSKLAISQITNRCAGCGKNTENEFYFLPGAKCCSQCSHITDWLIERGSKKFPSRLRSFSPRFYVLYRELFIKWKIEIEYSEFHHQLNKKFRTKSRRRS